MGADMDLDMDMIVDKEWWGYSKMHGWVVLDRTVACNVPGLKVDLQFVRASDSGTYSELREKWIPPQYRFAPNFLRDLKGADAVQAAAELDAFKSIWPAIKDQIERVRQETVDRDKALRIENEWKLKADARTKKKQDAEDRL